MLKIYSYSQSNPNPPMLQCKYNKSKEDICMKTNLKKVLSLLVVGIMALSMVACGGSKPAEQAVAENPKPEAAAPEKTPEAATVKKIGVAMPTKDLQRCKHEERT